MGWRSRKLISLRSFDFQRSSTLISTMYRRDETIYRAIISSSLLWLYKRRKQDGYAVQIKLLSLPVMIEIFFQSQTPGRDCFPFLHYRIDCFSSHSSSCNIRGNSLFFKSIWSRKSLSIQFSPLCRSKAINLSYCPWGISRLG